MSNEEEEKEEEITEKEICLIDCDQVLFDFVSPLVAAINPKITREDIRAIQHWDTFKVFNEEEMVMVYKLLEQPEFWRELPLFPHALKAIERIRSIGAEVVFVTAPWNGCKEWGFVRTELLKKYFNADRDNIIITSRKELVYGDMFIDDKLETVLAWKKRWIGMKAVLFETDSNFKSDYYPRIVVENDNWKIIEEKPSDNKPKEG